MASNLELVKRFIDAFDRGDVDGALKFLHPDVELLPIRAQLEGASYRGHEGYRQVIADFEQDWDRLRLVPDEFREEGDHVVAIGRMEARGKASGVELDVPLTLVYEFRDGLVLRLESFSDPEEALGAIGGSD